MQGMAKKDRSVEGSPAVPRFLKIGVTVARFQASGNTPVVIDRFKVLHMAILLCAFDDFYSYDIDFKFSGVIMKECNKTRLKM